MSRCRHEWSLDSKLVLQEFNCTPTSPLLLSQVDLELRRLSSAKLLCDDCCSIWSQIRHQEQPEPATLHINKNADQSDTDHSSRTKGNFGTNIYTSPDSFARYWARRMGCGALSSSRVKCELSSGDASNVSSTGPSVVANRLCAL